MESRSELSVRRSDRGWHRTAGAFILTLPLLCACGGVRVGQSADEAQAEPAPTAAEPPNQDRDAPSETTPLITIDLDTPEDAGTR